jgi:hypothetical protein
MEIPERRSLEMPKLDGVLARMFGPVTEVEPSFRLLTPPDQQTEDGLYEFYGMDRDMHVVMFNSDGNIGRDHLALGERRLRVFSEIHVGDTTVLIVPEGARNIRGLLRLMARDVSSYGVIFDQVGQTLNQLEEANIGMPTYGSVLDRFAWAPDQNSSTGGSVFLVPPYGLEHGPTADTIVGNLHDELLQTGLFDPEQEASLMGMIDNGRQRIG